MADDNNLRGKVQRPRAQHPRRTEGRGREHPPTNPWEPVEFRFRCSLACRRCPAGRSPPHGLASDYPRRGGRGLRSRSPVPPSPARCTDAAAAGRADFFALCLTGSPFGCVAVDSRPHHLPLPSLSLYEEGGVQEVEIRKLGPIFFPLQSVRVKFMWSPGCSQSEDHQVMEMPAGISDVALPPCSPRLLF